MKITDIKTLVVNAQLRNWVFVKVETDVPGLYGWDEGTLEWKTRAVAGCVVVALHFDLATPNFLIQEDMVGDVPWRFDVVQTRLKAEKGYWLPLDEPGLGVEINEAEARNHSFEQEILEQMVFHPDGSVAEW
jgi:L-alanine-DL-glutamate epimerase-like enolase superfamily enzyme